MEKNEYPATATVLESIMLQAEPALLEIDRLRMAVVVVDMQNAFVSKGGMLDLIGADVSLSQKAIKPIKRILSAARATGIKSCIFGSAVLSQSDRERM